MAVVLAVVSLVAVLAGSGTASAAAAPTLTYTVTGQPGMHLSLGWVVPGIKSTYVQDVTLPASGRVSATFPDRPAGPAAPMLEAQTVGTMPFDASPGLSCSITRGGAIVASDTRRADFYCLARA